MHHLIKIKNIKVVILFIGIVCLCVAACKKDISIVPVTPAQPTITDSQYTLVWSEEFNYTGLPDSSVWGYENGFIRNEEAQYYTSNSIANSYVNNGVLTLTATYDSTQAYPVKSASILTKNKVSFLYGRMEVRAKMPVGSGAWPAIWMEGVNHDTIGWPSCGEIDILEWLGWAPQYILGSIYTIAPSGTDTSIVTPYIPVDTSLSSQFHIYAVEWDSTQIKYFYDSTLYATYTAVELSPAEWEPFTKPQYLLLNLAIGGTSGGPIDYTKFPFTYEVDYVRYYQKK